MQITILYGRGIKGQSFDHQLAPVTLFLGRNGTGKTARIEALQLALCGYVPGIEKTPAKIFERLASGSEMIVEAHLHGSDGVTTVSRGAYLLRSGSVKCTNDRGHVIPPVAIDAEQWLGLSGPERVKVLFKAAKLPDEFTPQNVLAGLTHALKTMEVGGASPATEKAIQELVGKLSLPDFIATTGVQAWIIELAEDWKARALLAAQNVRRLEATHQGLTQVAGSEAPAPQDAEQKLHKAKEAARVAFQRGANAQAAADLVYKQLKDAEALANNAADETELLANIERLQARHKELEAVPKPGAFAQAGSLQKVKNSAAMLEKECDAANTEASRLVAELTKLKAAKICPTCGQSIEELRKEAIKATDVKLKKARKSADAATEKFNASAEALHELETQETDWERLLKNKAKALEEQAKIHVEMLRWQSLVAVVSAAAGAKAQLPALRQSAEAAKRALWAIQVERETLDTALDKAQADFNRLLTERAEASARAKATEQAEATRAQARVLKGACAAVQALREKLVNATVGPVMAKANALCEGLLKEPLAYQDGQVGMVGPNGFYSTKSFSGYEGILGCAALSLALAGDSPLKLVLLDDIVRADDGNVGLLLERVCRLQETGIIDQAVLTGHRVPQVVMDALLKRHDNIQVIKLG